jgi:hypothetical protein
MAAALRHAGQEEVVTFPLEPEPDGAEARVVEDPTAIPAPGGRAADWETDG